MLTLRHRLELETITLAVISAFISGYFIWYNNQSFRQAFHISTPIISANDAPHIVYPTVNPISKIETVTQVSPDGTKKLIMEKKVKNDGTNSYIFAVEDQLGDKIQIFTTSLASAEKLSVPFNSWSPDNKYLFIAKNDTDALVFKATGEPIVSGQLYFDIQDSFNQKGIKETLQEVTGWASPTLLIVNTLKQDNSGGSSFWYEVPTKAIIQLSSQF